MKKKKTVKKKQQQKHTSNPTFITILQKQYINIYNIDQPTTIKKRK